MSSQNLALRVLKGDREAIIGSVGSRSMHEADLTDNDG